MNKTNNVKNQFVFSGFQSPNYTQVPDELFDVLLPELTGAELKVLLYIIRRTFGFKKASDAISLSQMLAGIKKKDGDAQDRGVGLSKVSLLQALRSLEQKHLIVTERRQSEEKGNEPTNYRLNVLDSLAPREPHNKNTEPPLVKKLYQGVGKESMPSPWHKNLTRQQTVLQETDKQQQTVVVFEATQNNTDHKRGSLNEIVQALATFGISKVSAERLAEMYPEDYLLSKLELAEFLCETKSRLIEHNPAGYLRKSIEEDYVPPRGYKTKAQREAEAKQRSQKQTQEQDERRRVEEDGLRVRQAQHAELLNHCPPVPIPGTKFTTHTAWEAVKAYLRYSLPEVQYSLLEDTVLVLVDQDRAMIGTRSAFVCRYLASRVSSKLQQAFEETLKQRFEPQFQVVKVAPGLASG